VADPRPQGRRTIRSLLDEHGVRPNQAYGQNFLTDPNVIDRIVRLADLDSGSRVVEIGAGTGTLTRGLAATGATVVTYEIDGGLVRILSGTVGDLPNVDVRHTDATAVSLEADLDGSPWALVANLPYNVGTGIVLDALRTAPSIDRFIILVQREVADRLLASPGSRTYGIPSVVTAIHATGTMAFTVPPTVFYPTPAVESAVVELRRRTAPADAERAITIAAAAFGRRRKMLRRSLSDVLDDPTAVLERCGIDPTARPEDLDPEDFVAIAREARR
jgi:16S rRNA (adenine1518-N6/adenine1519-N6)-dimethyltransferase